MKFMLMSRMRRFTTVSLLCALPSFHLLPLPPSSTSTLRRSPRGKLFMRNSVAEFFSLGRWWNYCRSLLFVESHIRATLNRFRNAKSLPMSLSVCWSVVKLLAVITDFIIAHLSCFELVKKCITTVVAIGYLVGCADSDNRIYEKETISRF